MSNPPKKRELRASEQTCSQGRDRHPPGQPCSCSWELPALFNLSPFTGREQAPKRKRGRVGWVPPLGWPDTLLWGVCGCGGKIRTGGTGHSHCWGCCLQRNEEHCKKQRPYWYFVGHDWDAAWCLLTRTVIGSWTPCRPVPQAGALSSPPAAVDISLETTQGCPISLLTQEAQPALQRGCGATAHASSPSLLQHLRTHLLKTLLCGRHAVLRNSSPVLQRSAWGTHQCTRCLHSNAAVCSCAPSYTASSCSSVPCSRPANSAQVMCSPLVWFIKGSSWEATHCRGQAGRGMILPLPGCSVWTLL